MRLVKRTTCLVVIGFVLSACGIRENIRADTPVEMKGDSAILLLGLTPKYRIHLLRGSITNGVWERPRLDTPEINTFPEEGYIFVEVRATAPSERLSISLIFPEGMAYGPCMDSIGPTFDLSAGSVNYVGDLSYAFDGKQLQYSYELNEEKAKAFLNTKYPSYAKWFQARPSTMMKVKSNVCDKHNIVIPVFIHRH